MDRITVDSQVHFGKPCIVGTRIIVQNVLELLEQGLSFEEIIQDYYEERADLAKRLAQGRPLSEIVIQDRQDCA